MAFIIRPSKPFTQEFRRVARQQLNRAIEVLTDQPEGPHEAIHAARKRFKRVRAVYRLIETEARHVRRQENARIRDMARALSVVRDATALIETIAYLSQHAGTAEEQDALAFAASVLTERRERIAADETDLPQRIADAVETCHAAVDATEHITLPDSPAKAARTIAKAWAKQGHRAKEALAACLAEGDAEAFHDLRKCGQVYWMHLSLLQEVWPSAMLAKHADAKQLVDLLGHEHDLSVLTQVVNESPALFGDSDKLACLLGIIITRQQVLRSDALELAPLVFAEDPKQEAGAIRLLWQNLAER